MSMDKLNKLIKEFQGDIEIKDNTIEMINRKTERVVKPEDTAKNGQFIYRDGSPVKEGTPYHIHYTDDLREYYMTGANHEKDRSLLIVPRKNETDFSIYNSLNKQQKLKIESESANPTESNYSSGYIERFFARKTNEKQSPIFEIKKEVDGTSPLYDYVSVKWKLTGNKQEVLEFNNKQIEEASKTLPSIKKFLTPLQYYRMEEKDETKEDILAKLGVQKSNGQTTTTDGKSRTSTPEDHDMVEFDEDY